MSTPVRVETQGLVGILEIAKPPANYFDRETIAHLADAATELHRSGIRALVLCSEGKHFCAGADFGAGELAGGDRQATARRLYTEAMRLFELPVPMIAAIQGSAVGGGLGLACAADFRVASPSSRLHANFSALGFHQGFALSVTLPDLVGPQRAADLLYTSRRLDGAAALEIGLVDRLVPDGEQRAEAVRWAAEIAAAAPLAVQSMKTTLRGPVAARARLALERELAEQAWLWDTEDSRRGIAANLVREKPEFIGR